MRNESKDCLGSGCGHASGLACETTPICLAGRQPGGRHAKQSQSAEGDIKDKSCCGKGLRKAMWIRHLRKTKPIARHGLARESGRAGTGTPIAMHRDWEATLALRRETKPIWTPCQPATNCRRAKQSQIWVIGENGYLGKEGSRAVVPMRGVRRVRYCIWRGHRVEFLVSALAGWMCSRTGTPGEM